MTAFETRIGTLTAPRFWFKLDNASALTNYGSFGTITSGNRLGPASGAVLTAGGKSGNYIDFPYGNNLTLGRSYFNIDPAADDSAAIFSHSQNWTFEFFFKLPQTYSNSNPFYIFKMGSSGSESISTYVFGPSGTNAGKLQLFMTGVSTNIGILSTNRVDDNQWHHCVIAHTANTGTALYIDAVLQQNLTHGSFGNQYKIFDRYSSMTIGTGGSTATESFLGGIDDFLIYNYTLSAAQIQGNYDSVSAVNINYTDTTGATASATFPNATNTAETVINVVFNATALIADTAVVVPPAISTGVNVDGGGVSTASADIVSPTIETTLNPNYLADPATATALLVGAVVTTTKSVSISASFATASALLSTNVFYGETLQDTSYTLDIRSVNSASSTNQDGNNGFSIGTQSSGEPDIIESRVAVVIKPASGFPVYNKIVKAKFDSAHVTATVTGGGGTENTFNVYVLTANPTTGTFITAPYSSFTPVREYLYTTRVPDDGSVNAQLLDLTPAFADSRSATYGIMIEHVHTETPGAGTIYDRTEYAGNNLNHNLIYALTSDIVSKNINAEILTATALATDAAIATEQYVNLSVDPSTASADIVNPVVSIEIAADVLSDPLLASAQSTMPVFNSTVEFPHVFATAHAEILNSQVFAFGTITYAADPATASADLHMPQANIGDDHLADHMNASAEFVMPTLIIPRVVDAMVTTASVDMPTPTANAQLLGSVLASAMKANAMSPNPPAYIDLFSDEWYAALYAQHSVRAVGFPSGYSSAFLKLFEDQNTDITQSTPNTSISGGLRTFRQLANNLTHGIVVNSGPENDSTITPVCSVITDYSTPQNESRLSVGYFDPYGRKAIRLQNIGIRMATPLFHARADFSLEFSIKTTKADQILSYGEWSSPTSSGRTRSTFNLVDGRLNHTQYSDTYLAQHPKQKFSTEKIFSNNFSDCITGFKQINDGEWHHVIMQFRQGPEMDGGIAGRFQIWIDGELDIQRFGQRVYEPDFFGANLESSVYAPDFYTSAVSLDAPAFVEERDIDLHNFAYIKYDPILAEPMTASINMTSGNTGKGNRGRALMLYWWPTSAGQNKNLVTSRFDSPSYSSGGEFDINMSPNELETIDYIGSGPQEYFGWDVFPVDINGYFVSDLVKEQAYGGSENIFNQTLGGAFTGEKGVQPFFKANRAGYFRNIKDDTRRYIDLVNDIDLSQFDAIFFKNYPDQSNEIDSFAKNEIVDPYFNIRETVIFEDFIKSLRAAVDTGISLMINNPQLAIDLKIVDRIEVVPDLADGEGYYSDPYTPTIVPLEATSLAVGSFGNTNLWTDTYRNNRIRVLNTLERLTDYRSIIYTESAIWNNDDTLNYGGANRPFRGYQYKENGLSVGDEFFISTFLFGKPDGGGSISRNYLATPINNVLAGTPITAFANQYRQGLNLVDNPYKNHVTSIAIKPGDVLDGKQVGGKIWVNFTDAINQEQDYANIDAIHTDWINHAYNEGIISLAFRNELLADPDLLETQLSEGRITATEYNRLTPWQSNGMYILTQSRKIDSELLSKPEGSSPERILGRKLNKDGVPSTQITYINGPQFFTFTFARQYYQLTFENASMNTRGLRWLSSRVEAVAQTQTHVAMPASATMVQPVIVGEKQNNITVQPMLANAIKIAAVGFAGTDRNIISLPLEASARITEPERKVSAEPMTVSAEFREQVVIRTTSQDQVVVYVLHEDPILYLREDIIK